MRPERVARTTKNPAAAGFLFAATARRALWRVAGVASGREGLDAGGQAALVASGLVLVDETTRAEAIEDRLSDCERGLGTGGVVLAQGLEHLLHSGTQHRTLAGVAGIADDGLLGALFGGLDVCHGKFLET